MSTTPPIGSDPASALFGATRRRVLGWLFAHPGESFYLREIARRSGAALGAVQRELAALTAAGILERSARGHQVFFSANPVSPIFPELQSLLVKTTGVRDVFLAALAPLADRIRLALLFGSAARGELRPGSDLDLLVVGSVPFADVAAALIPAQERLGRDVNPSVYPESEFRAKLRSRHHFLTSVLAAPFVYVMGGPGELEGLGAKRVGDRASGGRV
ncbi:MAG: nucleotidyltransferase domain-containing protein [Planctomycetia bacterium]|nr:nucleotidyltransferase domain-containing protein [Planctomycetia bacterium]